MTAVHHLLIEKIAATLKDFCRSDLKIGLYHAIPGTSGNASTIRPQKITATMETQSSTAGTPCEQRSDTYLMTCLPAPPVFPTEDPRVFPRSTCTP